MKKNEEGKKSCGKLFLPQASSIYNDLMFSRFFKENDKAVIGWAENVLAKIEGSRILPTFLNKKQNPDFKAFWGTITHLFALIVLYARKYKEIDTNQILFEIFIQNRGLVTNMVDDQEQMKYLFFNYLNEYSKRGRLDIVNKEGKILGELLRLIRYDSLDEFIFALLRPEATGWAMGFSSPCWDRTDTVMNVSKGYEQTESVESLENYPLLLSENISLNQDQNGSDEIFNAMVFFGNQPVGIDGRVDTEKFIIIDPNLSYEISLQVKVSFVGNENLKFGVAGYETIDGEPLPMGVIENGAITGNSIWFHIGEYITLENENVYYHLKGILLSNNERFVNAPKLNFSTGRALSLMPNMKFIAPIFIQDRQDGVDSPYVYVYDFKIKPLYLPFSQGYLGERDIIAAYYKNNAYQRRFSIEEFLKNYLIGYKNIFGSELIRPYEGEESYRVLFKVFSNKNRYILNATITINGETLKTDVNGEASIVLPRGHWYYNVEVENFEGTDNTLSVTKDTIEYIQLISTTYERIVTFFVRDSSTKDFLPGVRVVFAGVTKYTSTNGLATFEVFPGTYQYTVELEDYYTIRRSAEITDSINIELEMEEIPYYNVTFRVRNGVDPVSNASILVTGESADSQTGVTNTQGIATGFVLAAGTYKYKVVKEGFFIKEEEFTIYGNAIIDVQFNPIPKHTVTFVVKSNALPIAKANVTFNGITLQTNTSGVVSFTDIAGIYDWQVSKDEFYTQEGQVTIIDQDITQEIDFIQKGYLIDFYVADSNNLPLEGVDVAIGTEVITTTSSGQVQFTRISGGYNWTARKDSYYLQQGIVSVNGADTKVDVKMKLVSYDITFTVRIDNVPVSNQPISLGIDSQIINTDGNGNAVFNKVPGNYPWSITREGYETKTGTAVVINSPIAITVDLVKQTGILTCKVIDARTQDPLSDVIVTINGETRYSNNDGITGDWNLLLGVWPWIASKTDYNDASGNVNVVAGANEYIIQMSEKVVTPYDVKFIATVSGSPAYAATIEIEGQGESLITNEFGVVTTQLIAGVYNYTARKTYCDPIISSFTVSDAAISIPIDFVYKKVNVTIQVLKADDSNPISGATVTFKGQTALSDEAGEVVFIVNAGDSGTAVASKLPVYNEASVPVIVGESDVTETIRLGANYYKIWFTTADDNGKAVSDVKIVFNNEVQYTVESESQATTVFGPYISGTQYQWQASKIGYQNQNGSGTLVENTYTNITLVRNKCQVTYIVKTKEGLPISGVTIKDNLNTGVTSSSGILSWTVYCNESYSWTSTNPNYFSESSTYDVGSEEFTKTINIVMEDGAVLEVNVPEGTTLTLPVLNTTLMGLGNLRVNWGDDIQTIGSKTHTYSSGGVRRILFDFNGEVTNLSWSAQGVDDFTPYLTKVTKWFVDTVKTIWNDGAFMNCVNLTSIPSWTTSLMLGSAVSFFAGCTSLKTVPRELFRFVIGGSFSKTFCNSGLSGNINLSETLNGIDVPSYEYCFANCQGLTGISGKVDPSVKGTSYSHMFEGCTNLTSISADIGAQNCMACEYMFLNCSSLQAPCTIVFMKNVNTSLAKSFCENSGIESLPQNVFTGEISSVDFTDAFKNCQGLNGISSGAFSYVIQDVNVGSICKSMFESCTNLLNVSGVVIPKIGTAERMFANSGITTITTTFFSESPYCVSYKETFLNCINLRTVGGDINTVLTPTDQSVAVTLESMFEGCTNLQTAQYAFAWRVDSNNHIVTGVSKYANNYTRTFAGCTSLMHRPYGYSLTYIPECYSLSSADTGLPDIGEVTGTDCYEGCTNANDYQNLVSNYPDWV